MKISKDRFFSISTDLKIPKEQSEALWNNLEKFEDVPETTPFAKYLLYFGAMIVISAMTWFMNLSWEIFGGGGIFLIAIAYAFLFTLLGSMLWNKKDLRVAAGLLITIAVCMVPLAIYGLEVYFNMWPSDDAYEQSHDFYSWVAGKWIFMELGTIIAGLIALRFFPFAFLTAPIFFSAWFLTMDIASFIFGRNVGWEEMSWLSLCFGLIMIVIGFLIDRRKKEDYAFWSYFFGTLSFWCGLNGLVWGKGEFALFIFFIINLMIMCLAILVRRNILMVFGAIGAFAYLAHLAYDIFENSLLFPFALSFIGLMLIYLGILYQKNAQWIERKMFEKLPSIMKNFLSDQKDI